MAEALITLYESVFDHAYLASARDLLDRMEQEFSSADRPEQDQAYYDSAEGDGTLAVRPRGLYDSPIPSGNAAAASALLRFAALTGQDQYARRAEAILRSAGMLFERAPLAVPYMLSALDFHLADALQVALVGPPGADRHELVRTVYRHYLPNKVLAVGEGSEPGLLRGREPIEGNAAAYVCRKFACRLPVTDPGDLEKQLQER
jgi:uncharacterized protein YyaL (SSP411 family)